MVAHASPLRVMLLDLLDRLDSVRACLVVDRPGEAAEVADEFRGLLAGYQTAHAAAYPCQDQSQQQ